MPRPLLPLACLFAACAAPPEAGSPDAERPREDSAPAGPDTAGDSGADPGTDSGGETGGEPGPVGSGAPIVVWWSIDTLSTPVATASDTCGAIAAVLAPHGLTVGCLDGAIAPSSWTRETHARLLWPELLGDPYRAETAPVCGLDAVGRRMADALGGQWYFAADNPTFGVGDTPCDAEATAWTQGADGAWTQAPSPDILGIPEEARPVHAGIDAVLAAAAAGGPVFASLNSFEGGSHAPVCWFSPDSPSCRAIWDVGLAAGVVGGDDAWASVWRNQNAVDALVAATAAAWGDDPARLRGAWLDTQLEATLFNRDKMVLERLDRLAAGLAASERLGDLRLVFYSDHGEDPVIPEALSGLPHYAHGGLPSEYTAHVPVIVSPAAVVGQWRASGLVGGPGEPFALANVTYGLMNEVGLAIPPEWPAPEPVGTATSWYCAGADAGVHVAGEWSVRCGDVGGVHRCETFDWFLPVVGEVRDPVAQDRAPDSLRPWVEGAADGDWFMGACRARGAG